MIRSSLSPGELIVLLSNAVTSHSEPRGAPARSSTPSAFRARGRADSAWAGPPARRARRCREVNAASQRSPFPGYGRPGSQVARDDFARARILLPRRTVRRSGPSKRARPEIACAPSESVSPRASLTILVSDGAHARQHSRSCRPECLSAAQSRIRRGSSGGWKAFAASTAPSTPACSRLTRSNIVLPGPVVDHDEALGPLPHLAQRPKSRRARAHDRDVEPANAAAARAQAVSAACRSAAETPRRDRRSMTDEHHPNVLPLRQPAEPPAHRAAIEHLTPAHRTRDAEPAARRAEPLHQEPQRRRRPAHVPQNLAGAERDPVTPLATLAPFCGPATRSPAEGARGSPAWYVVSGKA